MTFAQFIANKVKAIGAAVGALVTTVSLAVADKSVDFNEAKNVVATVVGVAAAFGITYFFPKNKETL